MVGVDPAYLRRSDRSHAKAGNLNHALGVIEADVVAVLDADHVARPNFLVHTLSYFDDPRVALVQTPQDFYNLESFEHSRTAARDGFDEQSLFYRAILAGKNRWQAAFWCGKRVVAGQRAEGGRRGCHRHRHRGYPHHHPTPRCRLAHRLPQ